MIRLYTPDNEPELAILRSLLIGEDIPYHVLGEHFGTIRVGPRIQNYNDKTICVPEEHAERAAELFEDYFERTGKNVRPPQAAYTWTDKIRIIMEFLFFGWFMPGRERNWKRRQALGK